MATSLLATAALACGKPALDHSLHVDRWPQPVSQEPCFDAPRDPLSDRLVVISHPFSGAGQESHGFEVLRLTAVGELHPTNRRFEMGRAN